MRKLQRTNILLFLAISIILLMKFHTALTRQFDPDELSYLHWSWLLSQGYLPYKDFFFYITPLYTFFLTPLFSLPWGALVALLGRLGMMGVYILTCIMFFRLSKMLLKDTTSALLSVLLFTAFPMTFDKTFEIRPDMVMALFFLLGTLLLFEKRNDNHDSHSVRGENKKIFSGFTCSLGLHRWIQQCATEAQKYFFRATSAHVPDKHLHPPAGGEDVGRGKTQQPACRQAGTNLLPLVSGICFSLSFLVMFKIVFAVPAILFLILTRKNGWISLVSISIGFLLPILWLFFYLFSHQLIPLFISAVAHDAAIVNVGNTVFPLTQTLSPFPIVYVLQGGASYPWFLNMTICFLMLPGLIIITKNNRRGGIFCSILLLSSLVFLLIFPKPYVQYFIIPSMVVSVSASASLFFLIHYIQNTIKTSYRNAIPVAILSLLVILCILSFFIQYKDRFRPGADNREQLAVMDTIPTLIGPDETVYDMVGSYVFRPDGYFICCHPYIQFAHLLQKPLPTLSESLVTNQTKFIVMDQKGYVFWIAKPEDLVFITTHYLASRYNKIYTLGSQFRCQNSACTQLDSGNNPVGTTGAHTIDIPIGERYRITVRPETETLYLDNKAYKDNQSTTLLSSVYPFFVPSGVTYFAIQLDR